MFNYAYMKTYYPKITDLVDEPTFDSVYLTRAENWVTAKMTGITVSDNTAYQDAECAYALHMLCERPEPPSRDDRVTAIENDFTRVEAVESAGQFAALCMTDWLNKAYDHMKDAGLGDTGTAFEGVAV